MIIDDPELRVAFECEQAAQRVRLQHFANLPPANYTRDPPETFTDEQMLVRAKAAVARQKAWALSPEGRYFKAMDEAFRLSFELRAEAERGLSARSRSWLGEIRNCENRAAEVRRIAQAVVDLANAAIVAVEDELEGAS